MPTPQMASATDLTDLTKLDAEEVGSWTARCNIAAQETLLAQLVAAIDDREHVAKQLGIETESLNEVLSGSVDLNLSEIRLIGIAAELVVTYSVAPARPEFVSWLASARNWAKDVSSRSTHHGVAEQDPAYYGRRMVSAG